MTIEQLNSYSRYQCLNKANYGFMELHYSHLPSVECEIVTSGHLSN